MAPTRHSSTHQCSLIFVPATQKAAADWSKRRILDCDWPSYGTGHEVSSGTERSDVTTRQLVFGKKFATTKLNKSEGQSALSHILQLTDVSIIS